MNEIEFWNLIATAKEQSKGNGDQQVASIQESLTQLPESAILEFDRLLNEFMAKSYTRNLWAAAYIINGGCSDDGFEYFRAWLIAQGKEVFQKALKDPETLVDVAVPEESDLELLLYAAVNAYTSKTGKQFPYPEHPALELEGEEWDEDEEQLQKMYPKLFKKFWDASPVAEAPAQGYNSLLNAVKEMYPQQVSKIMENQRVKETTSGEKTPSDIFSTLRNLMGGKAEPANDPEGLYTQAVFLALDETPENLKKAAGLLEQAAQQGHAGAQYLLGNCYHLGNGVSQDYKKALKWYQQSAEQENGDACSALGELYEKGLGVEQDDDQALQWYQRGAELGSADGEYGLGLLYAKEEAAW